MDELIDQLKSDAADWNGDRYIKRDLLNAAEALTKLQAEIEKVKAERDAAVNDLQRIKSCKVCKYCEPLKTLIPPICRKCSHGDK